MTERGIQDLLRGYFNQWMIGDPPNGYAVPSWVNQIQNPGNTIKAVIPLDDEESDAMEPAMAELKLRDALAYTVLELSYGHGYMDSEISRTFLIDGNRATTRDIHDIRQGAESRLEARLGMPEIDTV